MEGEMEAGLLLQVVAYDASRSSPACFHAGPGRSCCCPFPGRANRNRDNERATDLGLRVYQCGRVTTRSIG